MKVSTDRFRELVAQALEELPPRFRKWMDNVDIVVEERPPVQLGRRFKGLLLGLYQGVPLTRRSTMDMQLPDKISLYQRSIEQLCQTEAEIRAQVRTTLLHEIGHHFGLSEAELESLEEEGEI